MKKIPLMAAAACLFVSSLLSAQSGGIIDEILAENEISAESAAYLILCVAGEEPASRREAMERMRDRFARIGEKPTVGEYAFELQNELGLPRGFFSTLFPGPRYSFRDLKFLGIIQERVHPGDRLSGERALRILGRALEEKEDRS